MKPLINPYTGDLQKIVDRSSDWYIDANIDLLTNTISNGGGNFTSLETSSTNGLIIPSSNTYVFTRNGDADTGVYFNVTSERIEVHRDGNVRAAVSAQSSQTYSFLAAASVALLVPATSNYVFALTGTPTSGMYYNASTMDVEFHAAGVTKHTLDLNNGDYTAGRDITSTRNIIVGSGAAGVDNTITFNGETNDYQLINMEDESELRLSANADATNYLAVEADGTIEFNGTSTVWNDIVLPLDSAKVPAANAPNWESFVGNLNAYAYEVNDYQEFTSELLHGYKTGSDLEFHIHGALNAALAGGDETVKFEIEYSIADMDPSDGLGDVFPATTTINSEFTVPNGTADLTNIYISIGTDSTGSFGMGATIKGRLRRIASSGTDLVGDIFVTQVGIHYEIDTVGSRQITTK